MVVSTAVAAVLIYHMPRQCDPPHAWYQGKVILDVSPDLAEDGVTLGRLDLDALRTRLPSYSALGAQTLHLKGLGAARRDKRSGDFVNRPTAELEENYASVFGKRGSELESSLRSLSASLHALNMTLMVQVPVKEREGDSSLLELDHSVSRAVVFWAGCGVDGIFLDGLERFLSPRGEADLLARYLGVWETLFEQSATTDNERVIMGSYDLVRRLEKEGKDVDKVGVVRAMIEHYSTTTHTPMTPPRSGAAPLLPVGRHLKPGLLRLGPGGG